MRFGWLPTLVSVAFLTGPGPATAERLAGTAVPDHYDLAFDLDLPHARFDCTETIQVRLTEPSRRIVLHAVDLEFRESTIESHGITDNASVTLDGATETAALTVSREIPAGVVTIRLRFGGRLGDKLRGLYLSRAAGRRYAVTQFESTDARRAFAAFDEPAYKATFAIAVTIDRRDTAISNGRVLSDTAGPGSRRHTLTFAETPKMSTYLVALAVGDFRCLTGKTGEVPIRVCATPDKKHLGHVALDAAEQILGYYNSYFSIRYPFGKLDLVAVPDFAAGGMENTAAIFFREADLVADARTASVSSLKGLWSLIAHEIAHQWFGDLVTMRWWDDLWLNEGFATWMEKRALAAAKPEWHVAVDEAAETEGAINTDSLATTRAIRAPVETPSEIEATFDSIAYEKGAAVLRMLEGYLGHDVFRRSVNVYLERHAYGSATSESFAAVMTETSGQPVDRILSAFLTQPGVPLVTLSDACAAGRPDTLLSQQRFVLGTSESTSSASSAWVIPLCAKAANSSVTKCLVFSDQKVSAWAPPGRCSTWTMLNAGALGYYRVEYPRPMLRALAADAQSQLTDAERLSLLGTEWALVREGRHSVADYLTLAAGLGGERSSAVLSELVKRLDFIHDYLTTTQTQPLLEGFVRSLLRPLVSELGLSGAPGDSPDRLALRATVIGALGNAGNDHDVSAQARDALIRSLTGTLRLEPTAANAVINVAARRGDTALWNALVDASRRATSPAERNRYLYGLAHFQDPALVERGLEQALSPAMRNQDAGLYVGRFLANPAINATAWAFVKKRWKDLAPKLAVSMVNIRLVESLGSFCDVAARDDVRTFLAEHELPGTARALEQALDRMDTCIATRKQQTPVLTDWLSLRTKL